MRLKKARSNPGLFVCAWGSLGVGCGQAAFGPLARKVDSRPLANSGLETDWQLLMFSKLIATIQSGCRGPGEQKLSAIYWFKVCIALA
jgi:hypothetical protein